MKRYQISCIDCGGITTKVYARKNNGKCKSCVTGVDQKRSKGGQPTRNERIIEHGWQAYAREEGHYDTP